MPQDITLGRPTDAGTESAAGEHQCSCGCADTDIPVLDARAIPKPIRHGAIFGALGTVDRGAAMRLIAPHDPLPLLAQIQERMPGAFGVEYVERADDGVTVQFTRN